MTALGMTALHLRIADFKFTHNFIICDRLPDMEIIFGNHVEKEFSLSYTWDNIVNDIHNIKGKTSVNILVSNYTNKHIPLTKENM